MVAGERGRRRRRGLDEVKLMFIDEWVELPSEFWKRGRYARLRRWLYGMRKAASGWEEDYAEKLKAEGFARGVGAPTVFYNAATQ
eukprot:6070082-Lingulodinium_polyedra.AAC.1